MEIKQNSGNVRVHGERNKSVIRKSLKDFGAGRSIVMDSENVIIAGNGVYEEAQKLKIPAKVIESDGRELVVIKRTDLKTADKKRKALAIADNRSSDLSDFDDEALAKALEELEEFHESVGFTEKEIEKIFSELHKEGEIEPEIEFAEELLEEHNYIVLYFDNSVDWLQAQTLFNLKTVKDSSAKPGYNRKGIGRVLNGAEAINKLLDADK